MTGSDIPMAFAAWGPDLVSLLDLHVGSKQLRPQRFTLPKSIPAHLLSPSHDGLWQSRGPSSALPPAFGDCQVEPRLLVLPVAKTFCQLSKCTCDLTWIFSGLNNLHKKG